MEEEEVPREDPDPRAGLAKFSSYVLDMQEEDRTLFKYSAKFDCVSDLRKLFKFSQKLQTAEAINYEVYTKHRLENQEKWYYLNHVNCSSYIINSKGHVKNVQTDKFLKASTKVKTDKSERRVLLTDNQGKQVKLSLHLLVAKVFLEPSNDPSYTTVYQLDNDKSNCDVNNLYWGPLHGTEDNLNLARLKGLHYRKNRGVRLNPKKYAENGLLKPYTWGLEIKDSRKYDKARAEWRPFYTAFDRDELIEDLRVRECSQVKIHPCWEEDLRDKKCFNFNSDIVYRYKENFDFYTAQASWHCINRNPDLVISIYGVICDRKTNTIGSGKRDITMSPYRMYWHEALEYDENTKSNKTIRFAIPIHIFMMHSWFGVNARDFFLEDFDDINKEKKPVIYHADGNLLHNHLFNLFIGPPVLNLFDESSLPIIYSILDRIEPYWEEIQQKQAGTSPGMTPGYARNIFNERFKKKT